MQVMKVTPSINVHCPTKVTRPSFGYCPTPKQAEAISFFYKNAPKKCIEIWEKAMAALTPEKDLLASLNLSDTPFSKLRDALMMTVEKEGARLMKEANRKQRRIKHPHLFSALDTATSTLKALASLFKGNSSTKPPRASGTFAHRTA